MKTDIWIVTTCIPEPGEGPCLPSPFSTEAEAEAYADEMMRGEWATVADSETGLLEVATGEQFLYSGHWREAQDILVELNGETWGIWQITKHTIDAIDTRTIYALAVDDRDGTQCLTFNTEAERTDWIWQNCVDVWRDGERIDPEQLVAYRSECDDDWSIPMEGGNWAEHCTISFAEHEIKNPPHPADAFINRMSQFTTPEDEFAPEPSPTSSGADAFINRMSQFTTPEDEFNDPDLNDGKHETVEDYIADMSDERLCDEYSAFMEMVREARKIRDATAAPPAHIRKFLDASTGHLTESDAEWCSNNADNAISDVAMLGGRQAPLISETPYGFFFHAAEERVYEMPDTVWALMQKARELDCDYVLLDCDAEAIDGLPTYEW